MSDFSQAIMYEWLTNEETHPDDRAPHQEDAKEKEHVSLHQ